MDLGVLRAEVEDQRGYVFGLEPGGKIGGQDVLGQTGGGDGGHGGCRSAGAEEHGDQDEQVPIRRSEEMVDALRKCGGNPKFTILKGFPHDIHKTYGDENIYKWMLQYRLNSKPQFDNQALAVNDTVTKTQTIVETKKKEKVKDKEKKVKTKDNMVAPPSQARKTIRKPDHQAQTDTLKGKDFILVF